MNRAGNKRTLSRTILCVVVLLILPTIASAVSRNIASGRSICDVTESACLDGSITWYLNRKMITIEGRIKRPVAPGKMIFMFSGILGTGEQVFHTHVLKIRGKRGEIVDERFRPPFSNQTVWSLNRLTYVQVLDKK